MIKLSLSIIFLLDLSFDEIDIVNSSKFFFKLNSFFGTLILMIFFSKDMSISKELLDSQSGIRFYFEKFRCKKIIEEVVLPEYSKLACISGGFFTKLNEDLSPPDIFIFAGEEYVPSEDYLNKFVKEPFCRDQFIELVSFLVIFNFPI